ncbi:hypothetical protein OHV05_03245 [Kitasatospora sp. NBC_00070]|uniref:hypothetical protein n=1 Tax=Kitasatospora sp. NBC_00070 TaxID=2975962 RepID=UPI0032446DC9
MARALRRRLTADPALLGRGDCGLEWVLAENDEPERIRLRFRNSAPDGAVRSLMLPVPVDGRPPGEQAAAIASRLMVHDPVDGATTTWD